MRKIIEADGKFYVQETIIGEEITVQRLEEQLKSARAHKEAVLTHKEKVLTEREAAHDLIIENLESDLGAVKKLQEPKTTRRAPKSGGKKGKKS